MGLLSNPSVHVLGAGPSGLLAAHAAEQRGYQVKVFSSPTEPGGTIPRKSELHGCQYLHNAIPGITAPAGRAVRYDLIGTGDGYRRKVYGESWTGQVSPDEYGPEGSHLAWDLRTAYDALWDRWRSRIVALDMLPWLAENASKRATTKRDIVYLSTIPAPALCLDKENHKFASQSVWAMGSTREDFTTGRSAPYYAPEMTVQCNGDRDTAWYRAATVFGASTIEWPGGRKPPFAGVVAVSKPLSTDCTCHLSKRWHRLGRFGKWEKGYLVHRAYEETLELLG